MDMTKSWPKPQSESKGIMYIEGKTTPYIGVRTTFGFFRNTAHNLAEANYLKKTSDTGMDDGIETKDYMYWQEHFVVPGKYKKPTLSFVYCVKVHNKTKEYSTESPTNKNTHWFIGEKGFVKVVSMEQFKKEFYKVYPWKD